MIDKILKYMVPSLLTSSLFQLSFFYALYLGVTSGAEWYWWVGSILMSFFGYSMIGNNIGLHRYFTHGHFEVSKPVEYFLLWLGSMTGLGDPLSYAITHTIHHKYSDTKYDPHGPVRGIKSLLVWFQKPVDPKETPVFNRRVAELTRKYWWVHKFYVPLFLLNALVLYFISYKVFLFLWFIPAGLSCWGIASAVLRQHWGMSAQNSKLANWEIYFEGLHLNHHLHPAAPDTAINPGEIDWTYQLSRVFRPKYDWQGQPNRD
jgi:stearoyl-CoA desaturase (delta-9 desaturase)